MPLKAEGVSYSYPGMASPALDGISLEITDRQLVVVCGKNGSGKSTLLRCMAGLAKPSGGRVTINGRPAEKSRPCIGMAIQFPERALFEKTVYDEVAFGPRNMGISSGEVRQSVEQAIDAVGIDRGLLPASPHGLSYSQKRLVAIACAIAHRPGYLFLDEPAAGLDYQGRRRMAGLVGELNAAGMTVVVASHDPIDLLDDGGRLVVLAGGHIVADGPASLESLELAGITSDTIELAMRLRGCGIDTGESFSPESLAGRILEARR